MLPLAIALAATPAFADNVRGPVIAIQQAPSPGEDALPVSLKVGDLVVLQYPGNPTFLEGLEIEIHIPPALRGAPGNFAVVVYRRLSPTPEKRVMTISGSRLTLQPIPAGNRLFLLLPVRSPNDMHSGAGAVVVDSATPKESFPLILTIQPIAKGIPSSIMDTPFDVTIRPVTVNKGGALIALSGAKSQEPLSWASPDSDLSVTLNGEPLTYQKTPYVLDPGLYRLSIQSAVYQDEDRTFNVDRGKITDVRIPLKRPEAHAKFDAPRGSTVFLDGAQVSTAQQISIAPGAHTVLFRIGDYTVSRRFTAERKKDYEISLFLDIMINESK